jgi:ferredoxin
MKAPVLLSDLDRLFEVLRADGRSIVGPTVRDSAIVLAELSTPADLPAGWGVQLDGGSYRLRRRGDGLRFAHSAGPQSWKQFLHPPRDKVWSATRDGTDLRFAEEEPAAPRLALLGVRPCDLRAIQVLDHVLGDAGRYASRRAAVFIVTVNCTEPGETCFCVSAGGGPGADSGFDIGLTERPDGTFVAWAGSDAGTLVLDDLEPAPASESIAAEAEAAVVAAADRMGRFLPPLDLRELLAGRRADPQWADVAQRCLACGNCTLVCPTCFCTTTSDVTDLTGDHAERWERWESCFDLDFSYLHGGSVRKSRDSRYRQWLSHKFGTWHDQFGESGCVGCGRCIVWCPVGIDVTAELTALATHAAADRGEGGTP